MWKGNDYYSVNGHLIGSVWTHGGMWYWSAGPYQGQFDTEAKARAGLEQFAWS